ncbi:MAG: DNA polymerase III subunit gamma/tau [Rubrimonas sp.]
MSDALSEATQYRVLARKYRPRDFGALIGQEPMVRVLTRAFETGKIAHAYLLTGVRGVGKTTTARIIAKGLNCRDESAGDRPTITPCNRCDSCLAVMDGRSPDVLEIDAASNTGVEFIRDLNDMARTRPSGRYKIFILDEVHMLSTSAFNALLKTLEEPPPHVKFIFATTEVRKLPVTVLSRCQRFDLRRIEPETMTSFLADIAAREGATIGQEALAIIARAAEGSVRDALSLLDQALALGDGAADAAAVRQMIGLADRSRVLDLFEAIMRGDAACALAELGAQYADGADPAAVLRDLAEIAHWISVVKVSPDNADDPTAAVSDRERARALAAGLGMRSLARAWQILLKSLEELATAPNAMMAAEMAVIRLTHVADLPSPEDLVRRLTDAPAPTTAARPAPGGSGGAPVAVRRQEAAPDALAGYEDFASVVALIAAKRDLKLLVAVENHVEIIRYAPGRIEFAATPGAPPELAGELTARLTAWTGVRWIVSVTAGQGAPTIAAQRRAEGETLRAKALKSHMVLAALTVFPGADVKAVRPLGTAAASDAPPLEAYADSMDDDWAPIDAFDEE